MTLLSQPIVFICPYDGEPFLGDPDALIAHLERHHRSEKGASPAELR